MAFNDVGRFSIDPGQTLPLNGWRFGSDDDLAVETAGARIRRDRPAAREPGWRTSSTPRTRPLRTRRPPTCPIFEARSALPLGSGRTVRSLNRGSRL
jgi:hypothetical protein